MRNATASVVVDAPRDEVFAYLADIRNTPEWATEFIQDFQVIDDRRANAVHRGWKDGLSSAVLS